MEGRTSSTATAIAAGRRHIIKRPRLTRLLDESKARIIMLVAPAGYGKTTLAREWLAEGNRRFAWYEADASSRDIAAFARGVAAAAAEIVPSAGESMESLLRASRSPDSDAHHLADLLGHDLAAWPQDAWLVIDDYHRAAGSDACELFVDALTRSPLRLLVVSRTRPAWATARRRVYGEIVELGAPALTLTGPEAGEILGSRAPAETSELLANSKGWPAIIGLAAQTDATTSQQSPTLPAELYDYFAEEIFRAATPSLRHAVTVLSVAPTLTPELSAILLGESHHQMIAAAVDAGFLSPDDSGVAMHPLIRRFLRQRLSAGEDDHRAVVRRVASALIGLGHWDAAFAIVHDLGALDLLDHLLEHSLERLLDENRLKTLDEWVRYAQTAGHESPLVRLAEAEIALRRGRYPSAETAARDVIATLPATDPLTSQAQLVAARAANFMSRAEDAYEYATQSFNGALTSRVRSDAAWARINIAYELERHDLDVLLTEFINASGDSHNERTRVLNGRALMLQLDGRITDGLLDPQDVLSLAQEVTDPMLRTSFYTGQATALQGAGFYDEALTVLEAEITYATRARMDFVIPYALLLTAAAKVGLREFEASDDALAEVRRRAPADRYAEMAGATIRARSLLAQHEFDAAAAATAGRTGSQPLSVFYAEHLATHALARACLGHFDKALAAVSQAEKLTRVSEGRCLAAAARSVVALRRGDEDAPRALFATIEERGCYDPFVTTYRAEPQIVTLLPRAIREERARPILERARDHGLLDEARQAGSPRELGELTRRELEVLELLVAGHSNREIAQELFITEVTVKVHVRHIFEKLKVRSRTEAAVKAALVMASWRER